MTALGHAKDDDSFDGFQDEPTVQDIVSDSDTLSFKDECISFIKLSAPLVFTQFLSFLISFFNMMMTARYFADSPSHGVHEIEGCGLGSVISNLTGMSLAWGILSPSETLAPHAFGAKDYKEVGIVMLRSAMGCAVGLVFVAIMWWNLGGLLYLLNLPGAVPAVIDNVTAFLRWNLLNICALCVGEIIRRVLLTQNLTYPFTITQIVCVTLHPFILAFLIPRLGFIGVPIGSSVTLTLMAIILIIYAYTSPKVIRETLPPFSKDGFKKAIMWRPMKQFIKLAGGGLFSMCEWWYFEIVALWTLALGEIPAAAHAITVQSVSLGFMLPMGLGMALATRSGQLLGAGKVSSAKRLAVAVMILGNFVIATNTAAIYFFRETIWDLYHATGMVREQLGMHWFILAIYLMVDNNIALMRGLYVGLGKQIVFGSVSACLLVLGCVCTFIFMHTYPRAEAAQRPVLEWTPTPPPSLLAPPFVAPPVVLAPSTATSLAVVMGSPVADASNATFVSDAISLLMAAAMAAPLSALSGMPGTMTSSLTGMAVPAAFAAAADVIAADAAAAAAAGAVTLSPDVSTTESESSDKPSEDKSSNSDEWGTVGGVSTKVGTSTNSPAASQTSVRAPTSPARTIVNATSPAVSSPASAPGVEAGGTPVKQSPSAQGLHHAYVEPALRALWWMQIVVYSAFMIALVTVGLRFDWTEVTERIARTRTAHLDHVKKHPQKPGTDYEASAAACTLDHEAIQCEDDCDEERLL